MLAKFKDLLLDRIIKRLQDKGYFIAKPQFSNPIPDKRYLASYDGYWKRDYPCYGLQFRDEQQLLLCDRLSIFALEIDELPTDVLDPQKNTSFLDMDLEFLYCMIRLLKPKKFIEIGAGWSSIIARHAIKRNEKEGHRCEHTIIEPYRSGYFTEYFKSADRYINKPIQEVPVTTFNCLSCDDILFIDTSHIAKYGSDVNYLYFYIVPNVAPGCYIHIHDIFIPNDYPKNWIFEYSMFFSEQYLVTAFLMFNNTFQIELAAQYLSQKYRERLNGLFPRFKPYFSPGSLWIKRK